MPYYRAGDYYRGDYYRGNYAAGGILGSIGKFIGGAAKKLISATPLGQAINIVAPKLLAPAQVRPQIAPMMIPVVNEPGLTGLVHRIAPGGDTGLRIESGGGGGRFRDPSDTGRIGHFKKDGTWTNRARPRMNATNVRALKRAGRRVRGFLKIASRLGALPIARGGGKKLFKRKRR